MTPLRVRKIPSCVRCYRVCDIVKQIKQQTTHYLWQKYFNFLSKQYWKKKIFLYYFVLLVIEKNFLLKFLKKCPLAAHIYTLFFVVLGWGIFTANQPGAPMGLLLNKLFVPQGGISPVYYLRNYVVFLVLGCVCSSVLPRLLWERISRNTAVKAVVSALLALLCIAYVVAATNTTALYANF